MIPASIGGALTGALSMYFGCKLQAPHGGLFVMLVPNAINHALAYLLAIVAGSPTGLLYAVLKRGAEPGWRWGPRPRGNRRLADSREAVMRPTPPERRGGGGRITPQALSADTPANRRITAAVIRPSGRSDLGRPQAWRNRRRPSSCARLASLIGNEQDCPRPIG